jgi:hypothetical protein
MEADWEIETGGDAPMIDAHWVGLVDLRREPERASLLPETHQLPVLADALRRLNTLGSRVWTSKCDVFVPDEFDPDELDAPRGCAVRGLACYIDLLPAPEPWKTAADAVSACGRICEELRAIPLRSCRADLVIREVLESGEAVSLGVTAYITAAGKDDLVAAEKLSAALAVFADAAGGSPAAAGAA